MTDMIVWIRTDFNTPNLPFLIGELGRWLRAEPGPAITALETRGSLDPKDAPLNRPGQTHHRIVTAQQHKVAEQVPHCLMVSSAGLEERGDHVHWSTDGFIQFGAR